MQESLDSLNNSPDKKKKGLKGALNKVKNKVCIDGLWLLLQQAWGLGCECRSLDI